MSEIQNFEHRRAFAREVAVQFGWQAGESGGSCTRNGQVEQAGELDDRYNDVGYGSRPFRAESGPSHLPTAVEVAGRHELWQEAVAQSP